MQMSIKEILQKSKGEAIHAIRIIERRDVFTMLLLILVAGGSFGLGRLSLIENTRTPVRIESSASTFAGVGGVEKTPEATTGAQGAYVASKNGSVYHYPWCPGAARIKEENKVWFASQAEAEKAGLRPAANCKGL